MSVGRDIADPQQAFARVVTRALTARDTGPVGLAVSGGGDSIAMMHLAARHFGAARLRIITVDHGLRAEAAKEIALVADQARALGLSHHVVPWQWDGTGNLQAAARAGRWAAIVAWAYAFGIGAVCLGHTEDDQVETLLMRLARGSGIDGLAAMRLSSQRDGLTLLRPLLHVSRDDLRGWLRSEAVTWCDDPSNDDPQFDRVRARQMLTQLSDLGLTRKRLLQTVDHMQAARSDLQKAAKAFAQAHVRQDAGDLIFDRAATALDDADAPRRVMAASFGWIAGRPYRPRFEQMRNAVGQAAAGKTMTLGGCVLIPQRDGIVRMTREGAATKPVSYIPSTDIENLGLNWDNRWFLQGPLQNGLQARALGEAIKDCPDWRSTGLPRRSLLASPSVWANDTMLAAPLAGVSNGWTAQIVADFYTSAFAIED